MLKDFQDLADPEPRPDAWCRLYAARIWEELDEMLEGEFAGMIRRARAAEASET